MVWMEQELVYERVELLDQSRRIFKDRKFDVT